MRSGFLLLSVVGLVACGGGGYGGGGGGAYGGGGGGSASCTFISGGSAQVGTTNGNVSNVASAADGDLYSYATITISPTNSMGTIRATAQSGIVFPAGGNAGMFLTQQSSASANVTTINTYLSGVLQETTSTVHSADTSTGTGADKYVYFTTTKQYDAVEITETDNSVSAQYLVYEICADGHV